MDQPGSRNSMKTPARSDPDWPPIIDSRKVGPIIRVRDTVLTVIAWIILVALLWEFCYLLWDYFSYPVFQLSRNTLSRLARVCGSDRRLRVAQSLVGSVADILGIFATQGITPHARSATCTTPSGERPRRRFWNSTGNGRVMAANSSRGGSIRRLESAGKCHSQNSGSREPRFRRKIEAQGTG